MQISRIYPLSLIIYVRQGKESIGYRWTRCLQDLLPIQQHHSGGQVLVLSAFAHMEEQHKVAPIWVSDIPSHLDGDVPMDIFHFSQHGRHQGGFPRAHSAHYSHQLAWHNVQVHAEREKCIWRRWGGLFKRSSSHFSDSLWDVWYLEIFLSRRDNLSWIYKTPKCFFNDLFLSSKSQESEP